MNADAIAQKILDDADIDAVFESIFSAEDFESLMREVLASYAERVGAGELGAILYFACSDANRRVRS